MKIVDENFLAILIGTIALLTAGIASGLTVGFYSLDPIELKLLAAESNNKNKKRGIELQKVLNDRHLVLCTLLIINSVTMEALPVCLDRIVPSYMAVLLSTTLVLFVGEILPQALTTGKHQIEICYRLIPVLQFFMYLTFPVAYPCARLLDIIVGTDQGLEQFSRQGLKTLINLQKKESGLDEPLLEDNKNQGGQRTSITSQSSTSSDRGLMAQEVQAITGVLDMNQKNVFHIMTPASELYMLEASELLDRYRLLEIGQKGYSRIPVYEEDRNNIIGTLLVKTLINMEDNLMVKDLINTDRKILLVNPDISLWKMLNLFQTSNPVTHLAYVMTINAFDASKYNLVGAVTLEDVIEEFLGEEIYDEFDIGQATKEVGRSVLKILKKTASMGGKIKVKSIGNSVDVFSV